MNKNLSNKTKAELLEIIESLSNQLEETKRIKIAGTKDSVIEFVEELVDYFFLYQSSVFTKYETISIINNMCDSFIRKEVEKDDNAES